jgi:hypothetical protein
MRKFKTGSTRDTADDKLDLHKYTHPLVELEYGKYMKRHSKMRDGSLRDGDNWQKGFPNDVLLGSAKRHLLDWELLEQGYEVTERGEPVRLLDTLNALKFNVNARIHSLVKDDKIIERNERI